jgi:integrase
MDFLGIVLDTRNMARQVRDARLETRTAREKLAADGKPYWRDLDPGLHLGYRRLKGRVGKWVARFYGGEGTYREETFATADDLSAANGGDVLDYRQAQREARRRRDERVQIVAGAGRPLTVADAIARYLESLEARGKDAVDARCRAETAILPALGHVRVSELTTDRLRQWLMSLAKTPRRRRTAEGQPQRFHAGSDDPEALRRRRNTANRLAAILRAALTHAYRDGLVASDHAWRRLKLFENVTAARARYLSLAETTRLLNACEPAFRNLVQAALASGCRYGELYRLTVGDFDAQAGTIQVLRSKTGRARHVHLTDEGIAFFSALCAGRSSDEPILRRANGLAWGPSNQTAPMLQACKRAGISPPIGIHVLRHTYCSHAVMRGAPLFTVARALGHADLRMIQKHYGHLSSDHVREAIRAAVPEFGLTSANVRPIGETSKR